MDKIKITSVNPNNLLRISNYALKIKKSVTWVHKLIRAGEVKSLLIDGVAFVQVEPSKES